MKPPSYLLFLLFTLPYLATHAQVDIQIQLPNPNQFHPDDFWSVVVTNHSPNAQRVFLFGQLKDGQGQSLLMAQTPPIDLPTGRTVFQMGMLTTQSLEGSDHIPTGVYSQCIEVIQQDNRQLLGQHCLTRQLTTTTIDKSRSKGKSPIQFHGQARLIGQLSNNPGLYQQQPPNFLRFQASPSLEVMGIPLRSTIFLSTEQDGLRYDLNTINLQLDRATLLNQLQQTAMQRLEQAAQGEIPYDLSEWEKMKEEAYQRAASQLPEGWEEMLEDGNLEKRLAEAKEMERIEQVLQHQAMKQAESQYHKLLQKYDLDPNHPDQQVLDSLQAQNPAAFERIQQAQEQYQQYQKLKARYERLQQQTQVIQQLLDIEAQRKQLEQLRNFGDPALLADPKNLKRLGILNKKEALLSHVHKLGVGTVFPFHSRLTLNGLSLKGAEIAINPSNFYVEIAGGKVGRSALAFDSIPLTNSAQSLYAGKIGIGDPNGKHIFINLLQGSELSAEGNRLNSHVIGLEGQWGFWQDRLTVKGEIYQSGNNTALDSLTGPARAGQIEAQGQWEKAQLEVYGRYAQISPFYYSPGAPFLIRDRERYEVRLSQRLLKGRINWQAQLKRDRDNMMPIKFAQTTASSASFSLGYRPQKAPYVQAQYAPFFRENNRTDSLQDQQYLQVVGLQTGYTYTLASLSLSSNLALNQQISRSLEEERDFQALSATFTQSLSFRQPVSFFVSLSYLGANYFQSQNETWGADISGTFSLFRKWQNTLGGQYWDESAGALRIGAYYQSNFPISKWLSFELRAELNHFERYHVELPIWDEWMLRGGLVMRW